MSIEKICGECGKVFYVRPSSSNTQFCSMKCYHVVRTKKSRKPCPVCGEEMRAWFDYCSKKCFGKTRTTRYEVGCQQCGKLFVTHPSTDGKFCSQQCCGDWQCGQERIERVSKPCAYCGEQMTATPTELDKKKFCSRYCSDKNKTKESGHGNGSDLNRLCPVCEKIFFVDRPCRMQVCCSNECAGKLRSEENRKEREKLIPEMKEYRKTHTPQETADKYGMSPSGLVQWGIIGLEAEKRLLCPEQLTIEQQEVINGNLLGDGCLTYLKSSGCNSHFAISQKGDRIEYINGLLDLYSPYSCGISKRENRKPSRVDGKINHDIENWNGEWTNSVAMYTVAHPVFTDLRRKWYKEPEVKKSQKIIPSDLRLTWRTAAIWMCDDGSNYSKIRQRRAVLYTDCFTEDDVKFLIKRLDEDLGVTAHLCHRSGKPIINIYADEWFKFIDGIKPFIPWACFQYKCVNRRALKNGMTIGSIHWQKQVERGRQRLLAVLKNRGWELMSEYNDREMQFKCEHGQIFTRIRASVMQTGAECDCVKGHKSLKRGKEKLLGVLELKKWELVSAYTGFFEPIVVRCPHGKTFTRLSGNIKQKSKCDCDKLGKSGAIGISEEKSGRWKAVLNRKSLGTYETKEEAVEARRLAEQGAV